MEAKIGHLTIYVHDAPYSFTFYEKLFGYLGFKVVFNQDRIFAFTKDGFSFWFEEANELFQKYGYHRKRIGLNHIAFYVNSKEDVDKFNKEFLVPYTIKPLYGSPKNFPEYSKDYYAVYFEDPNRIKLEVAYYA